MSYAKHQYTIDDLTALAAEVAELHGRILSHWTISASGELHAHFAPSGDPAKDSYTGRSVKLSNHLDWEMEMMKKNAGRLG